MKKIYFLLFIIAFGSPNYAQIVNAVEDKNDGLTIPELQKAKDLCAKMKDTKTFIDKEKSGYDICKKIDSPVIPEELIDETKWKTWITNNLADTKFKSVDEAMALRELNLKLTKKLVEENQELFALLAKSTPGQVVEIFKITPTEFLRLKEGQ